MQITLRKLCFLEVRQGQSAIVVVSRRIYALLSDGGQILMPTEVPESAGPVRGM